MIARFITACLAVTAGASLLVLSHCGHGGVACQVIDAIHESCNVVRYMGEDGKPHEVQISSAALAAYGAKVAAARAAADGGAP